MSRLKGTNGAAAMLLAITVGLSACGKPCEEPCGKQIKQDDVRFQFPAFDMCETLALRVRTEAGGEVPLETTSPEKGVLTIDGHITNQAWAGTPLAVHRVGSSHFLLTDTYTGMSSGYIWDSLRTRLTFLGQIDLLPASELGQVVLMHENAGMTLGDIDIMKEKIRRLRSFPAGTALCALGKGNGTLRVLIMNLGGHTVVDIRPDTFDTEITVALNGFSPTGWDAFRGERLLLKRRIGSAPLNYPESGEVEVGILDVQTGSLRTLGKVRTGWNASRNVIFESCTVAWLKKSKMEWAVGTHWNSFFGPIHWAMEESEQILSSTK